jgi:hypothetical protein
LPPVDHCGDHFVSITPGWVGLALLWLMISSR